MSRATLLFLMLCSRCDSLSKDAILFLKDVIPQLYLHYHRSCVVFVYSKANLELFSKIIEIEAYLSSKDIQVNTIEVTHFNPSLQNFIYCPYKPPLYVLLNNDYFTKLALQEASKSRDLEGPSWIHMFLHEDLLEEFFKNITVPFNCKYLVTHEQNAMFYLNEVYYTSSNAVLQIYHYGSWNKIQGLQTTSNLLYERRPELQGTTLRVATIDKKHSVVPGIKIRPHYGVVKNSACPSLGFKLYFILNFNKINIAAPEIKKVILLWVSEVPKEPPLTAVKTTNNNTITEVGGFLGRLWSILQKRMNFKTTFMMPDDRSWGSLENNYNGNGSWTGMMGMLERGDVDIALSGFTMTHERKVIADFTVPFLMTKYEIFIQTPSGDVVKWTDFLSPFATSLWITLTVSIIVMSLFLSVLNYFSPYAGEIYSFSDCFLCVMGAFFQQGQEVTPQAIPSRMVYLFALLNGVIILAAYSAELISYLTKQELVWPFTNLLGLFNDGSYHFEVIPRSAEFSIFQTSNDPLLRNIYYKFLEPNMETLANSSEETARRLCEEDKYATLMSQEEVSMLINEETCNVVPLPHVSFPASLSIATAKKSPYTDLLNIHIQNLRYIGVLERMLSESFARVTFKKESPWTPVSFADMASILLILIVGLSMAISIYLCEKHILPVQLMYRCSVNTSKINREELYFQE